MAKKNSASTPADIAVLPTTTAIQPRQDDGVSIFERLANANTTPENMDKLITMYERLEAMKARKAFDAAMAAVRKDLPKMLKKRLVSFNETEYKHAELADMIEALDPVLGPHGLSIRWRPSTPDVTTVVVTCIVAHVDGHREESTLSSAPDKSGGKNAIQSIGSAITYLQRYTLGPALGVAASRDDDGAETEGQSKPSSSQRDTQPETKKYTTDPNDTRLISVKGRYQDPNDKRIGGQLLRLHTLAGNSKRSDDQVKAYLLTFGFKSSKEITRNKFDEICDAVMAPGPLPGQSDPGDYDNDQEEMPREPGDEG